MAHAEIAQVWPRDGQLRFVGRLHGEEPAGAGKDWQAVLVLRGEDGRRLEYPAGLDGTRFDVSLPAADLVTGELTIPAQWDLYLTGTTGSGTARLRAGRLLDDIQGKKKIMVFPGQPVSTGNRTVLVTPYYTIHDNLSVECLPEKT